MSEEKYDTVISIRIPIVLIRELDKIVKEKGYKNRAEAIRAAIREFIQKHKKQSEKKEESWFPSFSRGA